VPLPLNLLGHDIIQYHFLVFLPVSKEADLAEMAYENMTILYKLEEEL
jgi:hypothetical protein